MTATLTQNDTQIIHPMMSQARAYYDFRQRSPAVQYFDGEQYSQAEYFPRLAMQDVRVHIQPGKRAGCAETGRLGFLDGQQQVSEQAMMPLDGLCFVKWNGYEFQTDDGITVRTMKTAFIVGTNILGYGINV